MIEDFLEQFTTIELTEEIAKEAGALKRKYSIHFPDAVIGATAKLYGLKLVSKDKIFSKIKEIKQSSLN